jgi:phospholipase/lecithinase/hemolysin
VIVREPLRRGNARRKQQPDRKEQKMFRKQTAVVLTSLSRLIPSGLKCKSLQLPPILILAALTAGAAPKADLSRLVVLGDSLSAGYQNGGLLDSQQVNGYANLVATQAGYPLALPLIYPPGFPSVFSLVSPGPPPVIRQLSGSTNGRSNPFVQPMDLAVPGAGMQEILSGRPEFKFDNPTDLVLGLPGVFSHISRSQVEWAENLSPTTIIAWMGNMDALRVAFYADPVVMTSAADFESLYRQASERLAQTGATLVLANIPDVSVIPFMVSAESIAAQTPYPLSVVGPILGIGPGDLVLADALPLVAPRLLDPTLGKLPGNVVLTAAEVTTVRERTGIYNTIISRQAKKLGAGLVDINGLLGEIHDKGFVTGGQRLTTDFLGGIFSLDGVHPTNTGYAIVANEFIKELNTRFAAGIPTVNVEQIKRADPLVLQGAGQPPKALGSVTPSTAKALRSVMQN